MEDVWTFAGLFTYEQSRLRLGRLIFEVLLNFIVLKGWANNSGRI